MRSEDHVDLDVENVVLRMCAELRPQWFDNEVSDSLTIVDRFRFLNGDTCN